MRWRQELAGYYNRIWIWGGNFSRDVFIHAIAGVYLIERKRQFEA